MDPNKRAQAALTLIRHAIAVDDQAAYDVMHEYIDGNRLYASFADDNGHLIETMGDFVQSLQSESPGKCACVSATSVKPQSRRLTPDERYAERQAQLRAGV